MTVHLARVPRWAALRISLRERATGSASRVPLLAVLRNAGLTDQASLEDLLNPLNTRTLRWAVLDQSETSVFGVPALRATIRTQFGSGEALVGFTDDEAFLLRFRAPTEEALDEFIPTWTRMLDSIRPVTVAPRSTEELYFDEARDAISLASTKFMRFGTIFSQAYATRQRLILALLTAGVGTAFSETAAALQDIDPPDQFAAEHQALLEGYLELLRLDGEARLAVEDGDLAGFVLINGRLGEVFGTFVASMPAAFCNSLYSGSELCASMEPPPGGVYGGQLDTVLRMFDIKRSGIEGALGFPLSLSPEETAVVFDEVAPRAVVLGDETRALLDALTPPAELRADHDLLIEYFDGLLDANKEFAAAAAAGDLDAAGMVLPRIGEIGCETQESFFKAHESEAQQSVLSSAFETIVGPHIPCEPRFGPPGPP